MNINVPQPDKNYKVMVRCATYNHSKYICDALNGFSIQKTNFPFICVVIDDASKDSNQEVIKQYVCENCEINHALLAEDDLSNYIRVSHKANPNCVYLFCLLKVNLYGKQEKLEFYKPYHTICEYVAVCEGDDYWTKDNKLQKQVAFLDSNIDYSMCFHQAMVHYESGKYSEHNFSEIEEREYSGLELFPKWIVPTASIVMRKTVLDSELYQTLSKDKRIIYGDLKAIVACTHCGKVYGFVDSMSVYRRVKGSRTEETNAAHMYKVSNMMQAYKELLGGDYAEKCKRTISYVLVRAFYKTFVTHESNIRWLCLKDALANSYLYTFKSLFLFPLKYIKKGGRGKIR